MYPATIKTTVNGFEFTALSENTVGVQKLSFFQNFPSMHTINTDGAAKFYWSHIIPLCAMAGLPYLNKYDIPEYIPSGEAIMLMEARIRMMPRADCVARIKSLRTRFEEGVKEAEKLLFNTTDRDASAVQHENLPVTAPEMPENLAEEQGLSLYTPEVENNENTVKNNIETYFNQSAIFQLLTELNDIRSQFACANDFLARGMQSLKTMRERLEEGRLVELKSFAPVSVTEAAKIISEHLKTKITSTVFYSFLREHGYVIKDSQGNNRVSKTAQENEYLIEEKYTISYGGKEKIMVHPRITGKGIDYFTTVLDSWTRLRNSVTDHSYPQP